MGSYLNPGSERFRTSLRSQIYVDKSLLIHLGYLSYDENNRSVSIPNKEVSEVYVTSIKRMDGWTMMKIR